MELISHYGQLKKTEKKRKTSRDKTVKVIITISCLRKNWNWKLRFESELN